MDVLFSPARESGSRLRELCEPCETSVVPVTEACAQGAAATPPTGSRLNRAVAHCAARSSTTSSLVTFDGSTATSEQRVEPWLVSEMQLPQPLGCTITGA